MNRIVSASVAFVIFLFVFSVTNASAKIMTDDKGGVRVAKSEIVNDDLFIGAQTAEVEGTVNGDVFIGAQTVKITGVINGNLHAGANTLLLNGTVKGNVYAGAQNIFVSGSTIGGSMLIGAATVDVDKTTTIGGSILAGAGTLTVDSQVKRSVYVGTGSLTIGGNAKIGKDLYYATGKEPGQTNISTTAKIAGSTYKSEMRTPQPKIEAKTIRNKIPTILGTFKVISTFISFVGAMIIGFLYLKLFGGHLNQAVNMITTAFWKTFGVGFLVTISFIPALIILLVTVIGIPLAGLAILVLILFSLLAKFAVGMAAGKWVITKTGWKMSLYWTMVLGLAIFYLIKLIPVVGFITGIIVLWIGLGAFTLGVLTQKKL